MTVSNKQKIGILQGHGETPLNSLAQVMQSLMVLYDVEPVNLDLVSVNINNYKTLVIISPRDSFPPAHLAKLDEFLAAGKNICIAMNRVNGDLQTVSGTEIKTGLEKWLEGKGVRVNPNFIIDQNCGSVMVNQQQGVMTFQSSMRFPYLPLITKFADHPVTKGLTSLLLQFASSIDFTPVGDVSFSSLATTSEKSGTENPPLTFNINRNWQQQDFPRSGLTVCALVSGKLAGSMTSRMIIISDGDFPANGEGQQARQIPPDNLNLMVNSIDWLSDDTGLIDLRTKEVSSRPIDQMEDGKKAALKYLNFLLPIFLIIGIGIVRYQSRRNLRIRRMNDNYI